MSWLWELAHHLIKLDRYGIYLTVYTRFVMEYKSKMSIYELFEKSCRLVNLATVEMVSPSKCRFTNIQRRDRNSIKCKYTELFVELDPMSTE